MLIQLPDDTKRDQWLQFYDTVLMIFRKCNTKLYPTSKSDSVLLQ